MTIDRDAALAYEFDCLTVDVERGRLKSFANATGQEDARYTDVDVARQDGHPDLLVPPTFYFSLEFEYPEPFAYLTDLGVDLRFILHGGQSFRHIAQTYAGDRLELTPKIVDVVVKKGGAMEILTKQTSVVRDSEVVAEATTTVIVRNPESAGATK